MLDNIEILKEILLHLESYDKEVGNSDIKEFSIYLKDRVISGNEQNKSSDFDKNNFRNYTSYPEIEFSSLLTGLYRFSKHYVKKAFKNAKINTIDEFGFLATLLKEDSLLKKELINKHLLEISSGSEILKRLIKNELVCEFPDKKDRRAKRVSLTSDGREEIMNAFDDMHIVSEIIIGKLTGEELSDAISIFRKLTYFHNHIHKLDRNTKLQELHTKYID